MNTQQNAVDVETLKGLEPISSLSINQVRELAAKTFVESVEEGATLFREGDTDRHLVYLLDGEIELRSAHNNTRYAITAGMPESWYPVANRQPRPVTAVAATRVEVIRIDMDDFDRLLAWDQMAAAGASAAEAAGEPQTVSSGATGRMTQSMAFQKLPSANIEELFRRMEPVQVRAGQDIIRQGDAGDYYYLIEQGQARVTRRMTPDSAPLELAMLGAGVSFGEEALISDNPRNATVTMVTDGRLLRLAKQDFVQLLKEPLLDWVDMETMFARMEGDTKFLDVRVPSEFRQGHLPNAVNIPLFELRQREAELDKEPHYILYCSTGRRSSAGAFILTQHGFKASVLKGGLQVVPASFIIRQNK